MTEPGLTAVPATLADGRAIALLLPAHRAEAIVDKLVANAGGSPREKGKRRIRRSRKRPKLARPETVAARMDICKACPKARDEGGWTICGLCGCPMNHLNLLANAKCKDVDNPRFGREKAEA